VSLDRARRINQVLGGPFVTPWDVDQVFDEGTLSAMIAISKGSTRTEQISQGKAKVESIFEDFRNRHPTYRKN
jgi:hypothetical protein